MYLTHLDEFHSMYSRQLVNSVKGMVHEEVHRCVPGEL